MSIGEIAQADARSRSERRRTRDEGVLHNEGLTFEAKHERERMFRRHRVVLQRVGEQLAQRHRRNLQAVGDVGSQVMQLNLHGAAEPDARQQVLTAERGDLFRQWDQRAFARGEHVAVRVAERFDERHGVGAAVFHQVRQRVQAVEQEVRVDLARQRRQLRAQPLLLEERRAQPRAVPLGQQEHRLVDVRDDHHHRHDGEDAELQRVRPDARVAGNVHPHHQRDPGDRDRQQEDRPEQHADPPQRVLQPVLAARQPQVQPPVGRPDDERAQREVHIRWPAGPTPDAAPDPPGPRKSGISTPNTGLSHSRMPRSRIGAGAGADTAHSLPRWDERHNGSAKCGKCEVRSEGPSRASLQFLQLLQRPWPVLAEQPRQAPVGEQPSFRLAGRAVVALVVRVDDVLDGAAAAGTRLAEPAVHGHLLAKGRDLVGKPVADFLLQAFDPERQHLLHRAVQPGHFLAGQVRRQLKRRQPRGVEDLVRVGVADAAEDSGVGQRALQRAALTGEPCRKRALRHAEHLESPGSWSSSACSPATT